MPEYDDSRPEKVRVRIAYATKNGSIDKERVGAIEEMSAAEAKALVKQGRAAYVTDDRADLDATAAEANAETKAPARASSVKATNDAAPERPNPRWGGGAKAAAAKEQAPTTKAEEA